MTPLERLLEDARVDVRGTNKRNEVTLCCPFCADRGFSSDESYHLGLNTFNGKAHCFRCDWKSSNGLFTANSLRRVYQLTFTVHAKDFRPRKKPPVQEEAPKKERESVALPDEYENLVGSHVDFVGRRVRKYLEKRGVSLLQIVRHQVGYSIAGKLAWRAIFPVIARDKRIYGYVARGIQPGQEPKYLNSPGLKMWWGADKVERTAIVVEGIMDALKVEQALLRTTGMAAIARLGSTITQQQVKQLHDYERVIVFPDFDLAGVRGAAELGKTLSASGLRTSVVIPPGMTGEDPGRNA